MICSIHKNRISLGLFFLLGYLCCKLINPERVYGVQLTLDQPTDEYIDGVNNVELGDFNLFRGRDTSEDLGTNIKILDDKQSVTDDSNTVTMDQIIPELRADVGATHALVFTLDINERGSVGSNDVTVTKLSLTFTFPSRSDETFILDSTTGDDSVLITNFYSGGSAVESAFKVNFGYDFIAEYDGIPDNDPQLGNYSVTINSTLTGQDNGNEIYQLSTGLTSAAVPFRFSPTVGLFVSLGLLGTYKLNTRLKSKVNITGE